MQSSRAVGTGVVLLLVMAAAGCGGGSSSSSSTPPPASNVTIAISPTSATLSYGATEQFTATVTPSTNTSVTWTVSSSSSSSSTQIGSISNTGLYTAPMATSVPAAGTATTVTVTPGNTTQNVNVAVPPLNSVTNVTVTATSQADTSKSASATVTLSGLSILGTGQCVASTTQTNTLNCTASSTGTSVSRGQIVDLFVVGYGILPDTTYSVSGTGVTVTQPASTDFQPTKSGIPTVYFQIVVSPTAAPGPRNLIVTNNGNELTSFPGGLLIK